MSEFCDCNGWRELRDTYEELFQKDDSYGWLLVWIKLTKERGYTQVHRYGIPIKYCFMCGKKLTK
jgi:hypothetical protein